MFKHCFIGHILIVFICLIPGVMAYGFSIMALPNHPHPEIIGFGAYLLNFLLLELFLSSQLDRRNVASSKEETK